MYIKGQFMKERRKSLKLTLKEIADAIGVTEATAQRYESGKIKDIPYDNIVMLSKILQCKPQELMQFFVEVDLQQYGTEKTNVSSISKDNIYMIPVYDSVSAGFGTLASDCVVGYAPTYIHNSFEMHNYIRINVKGDSMSPLIDDGSQIVVHKQDSVDSGSIAVVLLDDEEALVKKIEYGDTWIELISINPYYPVRRFENEEVLRLRVVGKVEEVCKKL